MIKKTILNLFIFSLLMSFSQYATAGEGENDSGIKFQTGNWESILALAEKENKMIFLDAYASWCGPCKWMAKNVFTNHEAAEFYNNNFINAKIDMEVGEGKELAKKYNVKAYPTLLYLRSDGTMLHRVCGSRQAGTFIVDGKTALVPGTRLSDIISTFNPNEATPKSMDKILTSYRSACMDNSELIENYFMDMGLDNLLVDGNWDIIQKYVNDPVSVAFKNVVNNYGEFKQKYTAEVVDNKIFECYEYSYSRAIRKKDTLTIQQIEGSMRDLYIDDKEKIVLYMAIERAKFDKEYNLYAESVIQYFEKYTVSDAHLYNKYAWEFYELVDSEDYLTVAVSWAQKSVEMDRGYYNMDTLAALYFKLGEKEQASDAAQEAIEIAKEEGADSKSTEKMLEKINALN
jgi:thiol-disulfide isomerase/thioredoxin